MPSLNGNWVDLVIIAVLGYFAVEAYRFGLWVILADFVAFLGSLLISLRSYKFIAGVLKANFSLSQPVSNALGFLATAIIVEWILRYVFGLAISKIPQKFKENKYIKFAALVPGLGEGLVLVAFLLTMALVLPIKPSVKTDLSESKIGNSILRQTAGIESRLNEAFGDVVGDSITYLTIKPASRESVPIEAEVGELKQDGEAERALFELVNKERAAQGVKELKWSDAIVPVARAHAQDMWERKYFSHYSPEGEDVGDRLADADIRYFIAGENLALAPTTQIAHTGLMNSEGHRANILEAKFRQVGIGVIDNGYWGKMFVQVFTD